MEAFKVADESQETRDAYGTGGFGQGLLMALAPANSGLDRDQTSRARLSMSDFAEALNF